MRAMASPITSLTIVNTTTYWGVNLRKHQRSAPRTFVRGIHRWPANSPNKWPVTQKMFPFDDVIMTIEFLLNTEGVTTTLFFFAVMSSALLTFLGHFLSNKWKRPFSLYTRKHGMSFVTSKFELYLHLLFCGMVLYRLVIYHCIHCHSYIYYVMGLWCSDLYSRLCS